jgi:hypothetical protein
MRIAGAVTALCALLAILLARGLGQRLASGVAHAHHMAVSAIMEARYRVGVTLRNHRRRRATAPSARTRPTR